MRRIRIDRDQALSDTVLLLGLVLRDLGELREAEALLCEAAELYRKIRGNIWTVGMTLFDLASVCRLDGRHAEAEQLEAQACDIFRDSPPWATIPSAVRMEANARHAQSV